MPDPTRVLAISGSLIVSGPLSACPPILEVVLPNTGDRRVIIVADIVGDRLLPLAAEVVPLEAETPNLHVAGLLHSNAQLMQDKAILFEALRVATGQP